MTNQEKWQRFRVPLGSLLVDAGLVLALAFISGQTLQRLEQMDVRLSSLETQNHDSRIGRLETRQEAVEAYQKELKADIVARLERIERLLDSQ